MNSSSVFSDKPVTEEEDYSKLGGSLELKNVSFGFSRLESPLIEDFSMTLKPGSRVAFVGTSGCGKSTLMIARVIAPKPKILMFDEATSTLDNKTQKLMMLDKYD